ncbi:MAG: substrate-binding domain-containing protein [Acidobacteria bacterium]|nr:substrate-binding domain-containing protein [Acidobacteriota bacterium]
MPSSHKGAPSFRLTGIQCALLAGLFIECLIFAVSSPAFFTATNLFEILRFSVELGLLAAALTPVLITGGIDLSVGSTIGLVSVIFGLASHDLHCSIPVSIAIGLLIGVACGALNAVMIAGFRLPSLIVTLGTFSLYRGIAEGMTHAARSFTGYPSSFLFLGQGYVGGVVPVQVFVFFAVIALYALLLHRSVIGRAVYAIGFNVDGARYAGLPVDKYLFLVYLLCGATSGLAAIIYVSHLGLAKSDLGTGFELQAITAVVLGGTSVMGGRGSIFGTLLGLFFLTVLQNGMHLMGMPSEMTGVITGVLLLAVVAVDLLQNKSGATQKDRIALSGQRVVRLAPVLFVLIAGVLLVGVRFHWAHNTDRNALTGSGHRPVIAVMPKAKGDPYFVSARAGAEEAAKELGVDLIWDGPTSLDASQQNELVENWITRGVDAIVVAVENKGSISTVLRKARQHHIAVLTWDADAETNARDYFLNQATPEGIADALVDEAARLLPDGGQFAIITGALSAENQNEWIAFIKASVAKKHPDLKLVTVLPSDDDRDKAFQQTQTILKVYPEIRLVMAISAPAVPGAAEAVQQSKRSVDVIGLSLPSICKPYIHSGVVRSIVLWNTRDLGYLTVYAGWLDATKRIAAGTSSVTAGRLGRLDVKGSEIVLGKPLLINKDNIDQLPF